MATVDKAAAAAAKARGNAALAAQRFDEAIAAYTDAIAADPTDHVFLSNRSAAYLSKNDAESALTDAEACVKLAPTWSKGYGRVGAALQAMRLYDEAAATFRKGLEIEPGSAALKEGLKDSEEAAAKAAARFGGGAGAGMGGMGGGGMGRSLFGADALQRVMANPKFIRASTECRVGAGAPPPRAPSRDRAGPNPFREPPRSALACPPPPPPPPPFAPPSTTPQRTSRTRPSSRR